MQIPDKHNSFTNFDEYNLKVKLDHAKETLAGSLYSCRYEGLYNGLLISSIVVMLAVMHECNLTDLAGRNCDLIWQIFDSSCILLILVLLTYLFLEFHILISARYKREKERRGATYFIIHKTEYYFLILFYFYICFLSPLCRIQGTGRQVKGALKLMTVKDNIILIKCCLSS